MKTAESRGSKLFGNSSVEVSGEIKEADLKKDEEKLTRVTAITVYSKNNLIVDVSVEYLSPKGKRRCGPHLQQDDLLSSTFLLASGNRITEIAGVFNRTGLSYIYFKTSMRLFAYGELSGNEDKSFSIPIPPGMRFFGLRGEIGRSEEDAPVAIQKVGVVFSESLYLEEVQADGKEGEEKGKEGGVKRRMKRMQTKGNRSGSSEGGGTEVSTADSEVGEEEQEKKRSTVFNKRMRWKNPLGSAREGLYTGDEEKGKGVFLWTNGDKYVGQVERSVAHGWGVLSSKRSGDIYNGAFVGGEMHGWGELRFGNGEIYEGSFHKGLADGHGTMTGGSGERYVGGFRNGKAHGKGVKKWGEMRKYDGEWRSGKEHGRGKMTWADGSWYDGEWKDGKMDGQGTMVNSHGLKFVGGWKEHKLHGEGKWTFVDGIEVGGRWEDGKVVNLGEFVYLERVKRANKAFMNLQRRGGKGIAGKEEEEDKEESNGGVLRAENKEQEEQGGKNDSKRSDMLLQKQEPQKIKIASFVTGGGGGGGGRGNISSSFIQETDLDPPPRLLGKAGPYLIEEADMGGDGDRTRERAAYPKLLEGMPDAMLFEVGFTSSNILTAALKNALQGSEKEMEEAQKVLRAGLINLDSRSKVMREKRVRLDYMSKDETQHIGRRKIVNDITEILRSHQESMRSAKLRLEKRTRKPDRPNDREHDESKFDVLQFSDLLELQAPALVDQVGRRRIVQKEPVREKQDKEEKKVKRLKTAEDVNAMLRPVVERLKACSGEGEVEEEEGKTLEMMKRIGIDVTMFEKKEGVAEDKLTTDLHVITSFLKQGAGRDGEDGRRKGPDEAEDGDADEARLLDLRRDLLEKRLRELSAVEEEEKRRRREREAKLYAIKKESMLRHAMASAQKQEEERLLQEALDLIAEEEKRRRRIEEERQKEREEEAQGIVEMERMRRAVLAQEEAARKFSERRKELITQGSDLLVDRRKGKRRVGKEDGEQEAEEEDEEEEKVSVASAIATLSRLLGSDFKKFQWTFRFPYQLQTRGGEEGTSYEEHVELLDRSFVSLALQSCSFVPSAPVVKYIMDVVDLHVAQKINVFDVQRALVLLDYDERHELACVKLQAHARRTEAVKFRLQLEKEKEEEERVQREKEEEARKLQLQQEERKARKEQQKRKSQEAEEKERKELLMREEKEKEAAARKEKIEQEKRKEEAARKLQSEREEREREMLRRQELEREKREAAARREELEREREAAKKELLEQERRKKEEERKAMEEEKRTEEERREEERREEERREEERREEERKRHLEQEEREKAAKKERLEQERRKEEEARKAAARREEEERKRQLEQEERQEAAKRELLEMEKRREQERKEEEESPTGLQLTMRSKLEYEEAVIYAEEKSAVKIQAGVRGMQTRKRLAGRRKRSAEAEERTGALKQEEEDRGEGEEGNQDQEDLERTREVEDEEIGGSDRDALEEGGTIQLLAEEERAREVEEQYVKERAATRIQAIERGRQVRRSGTGLRERDASGEELNSRTVMLEEFDRGGGGGGGGSEEEDERELKEENFNRSLLVEDEGEKRVEQEVQQEQEHPAGAQAGKATPAKKRSLLKPLPPVSAPHEIASVAEEMMMNALGRDKEGWKISKQDIVLQGQLDRGNFAVVNRGKMRRRRTEAAEEEEEEVAVKKLTNQNLTSAEFSQFCEEARLMRRSLHPCVCSLLGVCIEPGHFALVMELVAGGNLHKVLRRSAIPWRTRIQMGIDLSDAVSFLHSLRPAVLHLDIKSPNLLVSEAMRLKLGDFGLAREKEEEAKEEEAKSSFQPGTVHWMAPELMTRGFRHEATDVFAMGVVLWELWTQKTPYHKKNVREIANAVISGSRLDVPEIVDPPARRNEEYAQLMSACWEQEYERRPSAAEVLRSLREILDLLV